MRTTAICQKVYSRRKRLAVAYEYTKLSFLVMAVSANQVSQCNISKQLFKLKFKLNRLKTKTVDGKEKRRYSCRGLQYWPFLIYVTAAIYTLIIFNIEKHKHALQEKKQH